MSHHKRAIISLVAVGAAAASLVATTSAASAGYHHHVRTARMRRAHVAQASTMDAYDAPNRQNWDNWRWKLLTPRCDSAYPMHEQAPCGTASGGPVGGIW